MLRRLLLLAPLLVLLAGCDQLGIESASVVAARQEADGKAVGAACRHAGRAIEDCFALNRRIDKASIYAGWREMDDYMRENKIEAVAPMLAAATAATAGAKRSDADGGAPDEAAAKPVRTEKADPDLSSKADAKPETKADARPDAKVSHTGKGEKPAKTDIAEKGEKVAAHDGAGEAGGKVTTAR